MPRLLNGHTAMGGGGGGDVGVSYDNKQLLASGTSACLASPCQFICNAPDKRFGADPNKWVITSIDPFTKRIAEEFPFPGAADVIRAGNGVVAASLDGEAVRLRNWGGYSEILGHEVLDVDRVTGITISKNRQQGHNISVFFTNYVGDGSGVPILGTGGILTARILNCLISWNEAAPSGWVARGYNITLPWPQGIVPIQTRPGNVYQPLLLQGASGLWILYSDQAGDGWLHPTTNPGQAIHIPGMCYGLDAEQTAPGEWIIAWSTAAGEPAGTLRTLTLKIS